MNYFLSHPMWQPLGRLSFGVYLVHLSLQYLMFASFAPGTIYLTYNMLVSGKALGKLKGRPLFLNEFPKYWDHNFGAPILE